MATTQLISMLTLVAGTAALCGFLASHARRNKRRGRGYFLTGFACGVLAGAIIRNRRRARTTLGALTRVALGRPRQVIRGPRRVFQRSA